MITRRSALAGMAMAAASRGALAQDAFPSKQVVIVVGFAAGGGGDISARFIADYIREKWKVAAVVDNKPGAGATIAMAQVARSKPDGYTVGLATSSPFTVAPHLQPVPYETDKDFTFLFQYLVSAQPLFVRADSPHRSVQEFVAWAKANPGKLNYASSGVGTTPHLAGEMLKMRYGLDITHVAYKGAAPALTDTIGGTTMMGFKTALSAIPSIQGGKLRCIAVAAANRLALMPEVPTMAEAGVPDFEITSWNGLFAPRGTHPEIIQRVAAACARIPGMADIREAFAAQASEALASTPEQFRAYCETEIRKWGDVIRKANISVSS